MGPTQLSMDLLSIYSLLHKIHSSLAIAMQRNICPNREVYGLRWSEEAIPPVPIGQFMAGRGYVTLHMLKFDSTESQSLKQKNLGYAAIKGPGVALRPVIELSLLFYFITHTHYGYFSSRVFSSRQNRCHHWRCSVSYIFVVALVSMQA